MLDGIEVRAIGLNYTFAEPRYRLNGAVRDAVNFAEVMRTHLKAKVEVYTDANARVPYETVIDVLKRPSSAKVLVIYYAGHGTSTPDLNGDEHDGRDEAMVLYDSPSNRNCRLLIDDDVKVMLESHKTSQTIYFVTDCCRSATIGDMPYDKDRNTDRISDWTRRPRIISLSACDDNKCAAETDKGGFFTNSLIASIRANYVSGKHGSTITALVSGANAVAGYVQTAHWSSNVCINPDRCVFGLPLKLPQPIEL